MLMRRKRKWKRMLKSKWLLPKNLETRKLNAVGCVWHWCPPGKRVSLCLSFLFYFISPACCSERNSVENRRGLMTSSMSATRFLDEELGCWEEDGDGERMMKIGRRSGGSDLELLPSPPGHTGEREDWAHGPQCGRPSIHKQPTSTHKHPQAPNKQPIPCAFRPGAALWEPPVGGVRRRTLAPSGTSPAMHRPGICACFTHAIGIG